MSDVRQEELTAALLRATGYGGSQSQAFALSVAAGAAQRRHGITRVQLANEAARPWRVTLGDLEVKDTTATALASLQPAGFPDQWPNLDLTRQSVTCDIRWGVGGAAFAALLDWRRGCSFVVHGSFVDVAVRLPAGINVPAVPASIGTMRYPAMITPEDGPSVPPAPPTLTFDSRNVAAAAAVNIPIPPYARRVVFHRYSLLFQNFTVLLCSDSAAAVIHKVVPFVALSANVGGATYDIGRPVELPPNARWLRIINDGAGINAWLVSFELDLG